MLHVGENRKFDNRKNGLKMVERLSNDSDAIGLNPIDDFQSIQKSQLLENVDISRIKVIYLEE